MNSPIKLWRRQSEIRSNLNQTGEILSWTKIMVTGQKHHSFAPYLVILVKLKNGEKIFGQLMDTKLEEIKIGQKVKSVLRKLQKPNNQEIISYGIKFILD
jgi:uncharacterized OB-fold protein